MAVSFSQSVIETERASDGAGAIVFDTSKLPDFKGDKAVSLFDYSFGDNQVEFLAQGYWQSSITGEASYSFGFGTTPGFSFSTPVFAQKVDLSLWFMLNKHWYFEASFADQFKRNTVAAGYVGDGLVKSVRIANRGIVFPSIYSVDEVNRGIGGGENQAPGVSAHLSGERWQAHFVARYDMLKSEEKTWYGKNAVSTNDIALSWFMTGRQFVLPSSEAVSAVKDVYVENTSGAYHDNMGRTYKKLDASQYLLLPQSYTVLLSKDAGSSRQNGGLPAVAIAFSTGADVVAASSAQMVNDVKAWFSEGGVDVERYFFDVRTDSASSQFVAAIDVERVLFVQHPSGFSPFTVSFRYDAGITSATDGAIASHQTKVNSTEFGVVLGNETLNFVVKDFFSLDHTYADVYRADVSDSDVRNPRVRYPFASKDAGVYLGYGQKTDLELKVRTYTAVARFDIGSDAVPGTVRVYKNGILDSGATYDSDSGTVTLSTAVAASDHIYATWYKDSESANSGAFAGAAGFAYRLTDFLTMDVSTSARWTYAGGRKFADADYASPGFVTLATKAAYNDGGLSLSNTMAASMERENTTGTYRILGMDDKKTDTVYLTKNAAVDIPVGFTPVLSERPSGGGEMPVSLGINRAEPVGNGIETDGVSGYTGVLSWQNITNAGKTADLQWAGIALRLPGNTGLLASASTFSIALKNPHAKTALVTQSYDVYIQLGVQAENDSGALVSESRATVPSWLVSKASVTEQNPVDVRTAFTASEYPALTNGWQIVTVALTDRDRSRLAVYPNARIIICPKGDVDSGELWVGPYQAEGACFAVTGNSATTVSASQTLDATLYSSKVSDLNKGANYVQQFDWRVYDASSLRKNSDTFTVYADRYFKEIDLQNYEELSLWFKYAPSESKSVPDGCKATIAQEDLRFVLDRPDEYGGFKTAVEVKIPTAKTLAGGLWHNLSVDLSSRQVAVDGVPVTSASVDTSVIPVRFRIAMNTADASTWESEEKKYYPTGTFSVDELHLSGSNPYVVLQDKMRAQWKKDGVVLEKNGFAILRDVRASATGTGNATLKTAGNGKRDGMLASTAQLAFTLTALRITGDAAFSSASSAGLASAAHSVQTAAPLGSVVSFAEEYGFNAEEKSVKKYDSAGVDFTNCGVPVYLKAQTESRSDSFALTQKARAEGGTKFGITEWDVKAGVEQKQLPSTKGVSLLNSSNYGRGWVDATKLAFDSGSAYASRRVVDGETSFSVQLPVLNLKPTLSVKTSGLYASASRQTFSDDNSFELKVPFSFEKHRFSVSWKKSGGGVRISTLGGNYARDMGDLREAYGDIRWFLTALPMYDLFSVGLAHSVLEDSSMTTTSAESLYYEGVYEASWKRGFFGNKKDLLLPSNATVSFSRDIRTAASTADVYQIKTTVGYTALNIFGVTGSIPLATWFQQDEYAASLSGAVKLPRTSPENYSLLLTGYVQANFFVNADNSFKTGLEGSFEPPDNWSGKITAIWKRLSLSSPVVSAITLFRPSYDKTSAKLTRTDSMNLGAARSKSTTASSATQKYNAEYTHALDIAINRYITLHTLVGGSYACTWNKIVTLTAMLTLGGTIRF
ncbi:MAG: hypothetical protein IJS09_02985 [Treponema sp.]|nr:hypothetical protein [Treponema sp.]